MDTLAVIGSVAALALVFYVVDKLKLSGRSRSKTAADRSAILLELGGKIAAYAKRIIHPRDLMRSPDFRKASGIFESANVPLDLLRQYATAGNAWLSSAAIDALSKRKDRRELFDHIMRHFHTLSSEAMYFAMRYFCSLDSRPAVGAPFVLAQQWWADNSPLIDSFREYLENRKKLGDKPGFGAYLDWSMASSPAPIQTLLSRIEHPFVQSLRDEVKEWAGKKLDEKFLAEFGRFWRKGIDDDLLIELAPWKNALDFSEKAVIAIPPRSLLITGGARTGKTSFLKLLGRRLADRGWRVFEASAAELMAGQFYFGQLEGRVRQTVAELDAGKHVAWFVTDIVQMAESGTHRGQSASVLEQILPAVVAGRLVILAEASPDGASRLFQKHPALRAQMEVRKLEPFTQSELSELAHSVGRKLSGDVSLDDQAVASALQLSGQYLGGGTLPGQVVDLLKRAIQHAKSRGEACVVLANLLAALSMMTGLPEAILDDRTRIDLSELRIFFSSRVIGQEGAVSTIVDRIAMLKAGLTDPGRPIGVFLFVGPTGTGKTELAKILATYLFGSPDRMTRLDMSEFQSVQSISKLVGERGLPDADSLAERIRKQPFSVVLLDEFEKSHPNVWDLFLQIFDDGRLSDANGKMVDFRHTIIILTSNLGATEYRSSGLGFVPSEDRYAETQQTRAVARAFRPEFVNRLDKIVVFKPLSRELMREILHKELRNVLERRGLKNREWVVEWEPSAIDFLLEKGFSPEMGARPLKRAIDQYLLASLASTLVEHRFPEGDQFLFVRSNGRALEVEFVDPDADELPVVPIEEAAAAHETSLPTMILQPQAADSEVTVLKKFFDEAVANISSAEWTGMKAEAVAAASSPEIWSNPERHRIFARVALFDRIGQAMATAERLKQRLESYHKPGGGSSKELVARLALQLYLVDEGIADVTADAPVDAIVLIEPVLEGQDDECADWCNRLGAMYRAWSEHRHMQFEDTLPPADIAGPRLLHVSGFGAFRRLEQEAGLHIREDAERDQRSTARVRVAAGPPEEPRPDQAYRRFLELFAGAAETSAIVRRYREGAAPLVRDAKGTWRTGRIDLVLDGNFDLIGALQ